MDSSDERQATLCHLCYWLLYLTSSQPMSGPWCVWGVSTIFSSVSMSLGSAKYDTYAL